MSKPRIATLQITVCQLTFLHYSQCICVSEREKRVFPLFHIQSIVVICINQVPKRLQKVVHLIIMTRRYAFSAQTKARAQFRRRHEIGVRTAEVEYFLTNKSKTFKKTRKNLQ